LRLGQSATTLSGGEAQRIKLAAHLQGKVKEAPKQPDDIKKRRRTLYIFDEPTTGLHFDDVSKLLAAFRKLIEAHGSVLVIEHNLDVIKTADWVIDLGPEGGHRGGHVVVAGPPELVARSMDSYTGQWLAKTLGIRNVGAKTLRGNSRRAHVPEDEVLAQKVGSGGPGVGEDEDRQTSDSGVSRTRVDERV